MNKNILLTGGAGFIGGNLVHHVLQHLSPGDRLVNLDSLTYASNPNFIASANEHSQYQFVRGDIRDRSLLREIFGAYEITDVLHLAAESHVDNSISGPQAFIESNIVGTFHLLETAREFWLDGPQKVKASKRAHKFVHVSTDEVYGSLGPTGEFHETTPYAPNSPYSASKASSDFLARSYFHTYGLQTVITHCSNNYGPNQHDEKLIPTIIRKALSWQPIPIYGDGKNIRDWLYVEDHCAALWTILEKAQPGEVFNIGGNSEMQNIDICRSICQILDDSKPSRRGPYASLMTFVPDRPGHDRRYAINCSKLARELGWSPRETFANGLTKTVMWYLQQSNATAELMTANSLSTGAEIIA